MKTLRCTLPVLLFPAALFLAGCLHVEEQVTFRKNGSGTYVINLDMSEMKGMMDMMKSMADDPSASEMEGAGDFTQLGQQLSSVKASIEGIQGISNVRETNDTSSFKFGYAFDFSNVDALNRALRIINKEKYDSKSGAIFAYTGKDFERFSAGDIGEEIKKAMAESDADDDEQSMEMVKMFFNDMSYRSVYHFPDQAIKKNSNPLGQVSADGHSLTVELKPFDTAQQNQKSGVATKIKLK
jgi:hypothetical protein